MVLARVFRQSESVHRGSGSSGPDHILFDYPWQEWNRPVQGGRPDSPSLSKLFIRASHEIDPVRRDDFTVEGCVGKVFLVTGANAALGGSPCGSTRQSLARAPPMLDEVKRVGGEDLSDGVTIFGKGRCDKFQIFTRLTNCLP